jgi:hypothetical protein
VFGVFLFEEWASYTFPSFTWKRSRFILPFMNPYHRIQKSQWDQDQFLHLPQPTTSSFCVILCNWRVQIFGAAVYRHRRGGSHSEFSRCLQFKGNTWSLYRPTPPSWDPPKKALSLQKITVVEAEATGEDSRVFNILLLLVCFYCSIVQRR